MVLPDANVHFLNLVAGSDRSDSLGFTFRITLTQVLCGWQIERRTLFLMFWIKTDWFPGPWLPLLGLLAPG